MRGFHAGSLGAVSDDEAALRPRVRTLGRVFAYVSRYPLLACATLGCAISSTLLVVVFPKVTQILIDDVIRGGRHELLLPMTLVALAAFFFHDLLNALRIIVNNTFEQ
jgi:ABC-type bacteriocin/lantibiotic exporter with double-glycine peptidase domain